MNILSEIGETNYDIIALSSSAPACISSLGRFTTELWLAGPFALLA